jgi:hypothetical protein
MITASEVAGYAKAMREGRLLMLALIDGSQKIELHMAPDAFEDSLIATSIERAPAKPKEGCPKCDSLTSGRLLPPLCDPCARKACLNG